MCAWRDSAAEPAVTRAPTSTACWMMMAATVGATREGHCG
jgi:hypothetical protein